MKRIACIALLAAACAALPLHAQQAAASAAAGVKQDPAKEAEGKTAATGWLGLLDRRDWGTAWERSSTVFRKNVPLGSWMDKIPQVREPYGALVQREVVAAVYKTTLPGHPDGDYVSISFASKFEKKPDVKEFVTTVRESDGRWRVTGYSAQ